MAGCGWLKSWGVRLSLELLLAPDPPLRFYCRMGPVTMDARAHALHSVTVVRAVCCDWVLVEIEKTRR